MQAQVPMSGFKIMLTIKCQNLLKKDKLSDSDPMGVLFAKDANTHELTEIGRTEVIKNNLSPKFTTTFELIYLFEVIQIYRVTIYDIDNESEKLEKHDVIGSIDFNLGELMASPGQTLHRRLEYAKLPARQNGMCSVIAEAMSNTNTKVIFDCCAHKVDKKDTFGKSDPFLTISRLKEMEWIPVHQTEYIKNTLDPVWKKFKVSLDILCGGDLNRKLKFEVYDWDKSGKPDFIGEFETTAQGILDMEFLNLNILNFHRKYSFIEYLSGGLEISFIVAVDFTASNGDFTKKNSLHYRQANRYNDYQAAIFTVGSILAQYDSDGLFPAFGFGARINEQITHCFPLNQNAKNPDCVGIQGILKAYNDIFDTPKFSLWAPTNFAPIINKTCEIAKEVKKDQQKYYILLILTDGAITDMEYTTRALIEASKLPISIVIVGIGPADFGKMDILDGDDSTLKIDGKKAQRDIVQFVPFRDFKTKGMDKLAKATLAEIPKQVVQYFSKQKIPPNSPRNPLIN
ncbi:copine [Anaeramoeba ignava]|uniref:Copine n=1 Tax=Anaeramoeba ignava TaxID=1746090 RepID=A0A9Q0LR72_ANAIG|nr:copine [Anaeramoeba ignava]